MGSDGPSWKPKPLHINAMMMREMRRTSRTILQRLDAAIYLGHGNSSLNHCSAMLNDTALAFAGTPPAHRNRTSGAAASPKPILGRRGLFLVPCTQPGVIEMKRAVFPVSVVVALSLFVACTTGVGDGPAPECAKYVRCCEAYGGTTASSCETNYGVTSTCEVDADTSASCEADCMSGYDSLKSGALALDAGNAAACP